MNYDNDDYDDNNDDDDDDDDDDDEYIEDSVFFIPTPCHSRNFKLNGGHYKIFWMMILIVTEIFQNMLVFKILIKGFIENQHAKRITKSKIASTSAIGSTRHFISKWLVYK